MSVLKNLRNLSGMEYYKTAIYIRRDLTMLLLRDFGTKRKIRNIRHTIPDLTEEEQKQIDGIFEKHGKTESFHSEMPEWFLTQEKKFLSKELWNLIVYITEANSIYPLYPAEWDVRRELQDKAIGCCYGIYQELQYIQNIFPQDLNRLTPIFENLEKETHLLKGWRQSDNKRRKSA